MPSNTTNAPGATLTDPVRTQYGAKDAPRVVLDEYLRSPPSLADRLLSGNGSTTANVKANRKRATERMLAEWQSAWDMIPRERK